MNYLILFAITYVVSAMIIEIGISPNDLIDKDELYETGGCGLEDFTAFIPILNVIVAIFYIIFAIRGKIKK